MERIMQGVSVSLDKSNNGVSLHVDTSQIKERLDIAEVSRYLASGKYAEFECNNETLKSLLDTANVDIESQVSTKHQAVIAYGQDAELKMEISSDKMTATLHVIAPKGGNNPSLDALTAFCREQKVTNGLSIKRLQHVLKMLPTRKPDEAFSQIVAKGLPPRNGRNSELTELVENVLTRLLTPKIDENDNAHMRDFGEIFSVTQHTPIARYRPATPGRTGFNVEGKVLKPKPGKSKPVKLEEGAIADKDDENLILANRNGMPKFTGLKVKVDDIYTAKGVDVGTGHVEYDGAVIINGDVADQMKIIASGDITIKGFVESAYIETPGNVYITEGAAGQNPDAQTDPNCIIRAGGDVFIENAQGLDIHCGGELLINKQIAYSNIRCGGSVIVGDKEKPKGMIIACNIKARGEIIAGTIGAISGSKLVIDFTESYDQITSSSFSLKKMYKELNAKFNAHKSKWQLLKNKNLPPELDDKLNALESAIIKEKQLLNWIKDRLDDNQSITDTLPKYLRVKATKQLFPGVNIKLQHNTWQANKEHGPIEVMYQEKKWEAEPIIS